MKLRVCHLTLSEAAALESNGVVPDCASGRHAHISIKLAHSLVGPSEGDGLARWVHPAGHNRFLHICDVPVRRWEVVRQTPRPLAERSGPGQPGWQMVPGAQT